MSVGERDYIDERCRQIVSLKNQVCTGSQSFVLLNQAGIDPHSLDILAKNGIIALRRVKRRNLERITLCCGGMAVNSTENLKPDILGYAGKVSQFSVGEENYTIVDECRSPRSVTLLIKGPNQYTIDQIKDAIQDGLMSVTSALIDQTVLPGAAAFELHAIRRIENSIKKDKSVA
ncbi:MAG: T-complex protein 1 subunit zeta, partial [Paramarteilia canceri]